MTDYWEDHAEIAVNEAGLTATPEQISVIAGVIESAHEFYGQMHGHDVASANFHGEQRREIERLQREVAKEKSKVTCKTCGGNGWITTQGPYHSSTSQCWKCNGDGRHD